MMMVSQAIMTSEVISLETIYSISFGKKTNKGRAYGWG